jgi:hypothetical protein
MAEPQANTDMSLADASNALEGLLARDENLGNEEAEESEAAPQKDAEPSEPPETPEVKEPSEGEEEETTEQETAEQEPEEQPLYTVKVDGKEQQVTLEELQRGYSGQKWISQRSQTMAAERKALEAEAAAVKQERAQYAQVLGQLRQQLEQGGEAEPDWEKLRAEDEFKFVVERQAWQLKQDKLNAVKAEQARVQGLQKQHEDATIARYVEEENRKVLDKIPAWKDRAKAKAAIADLREYAKSEGWTDEELDQARDSRAVIALYKAMQFDKLAKTQMPRPANRGPRSASPGAGSATPGRPVEITRDKQRLAQTGRVEDAAAIFEKAGIFE